MRPLPEVSTGWAEVLLDAQVAACEPVGDGANQTILARRVDDQSPPTARAVRGVRKESPSVGSAAGVVTAIVGGMQGRLEKKRLRDRPGRRDRWWWCRRVPAGSRVQRSDVKFVPIVAALALDRLERG